MRTFFQNTDNRNVVLLVLFALTARLIVLPWSQTVHADAVSRVFIAADWLKNPHYISEGYWGPLHHYLNAIFMTLFPGNIVGPKLLNIVLASLTAIPLYHFTLNIFKTRRGAIFVVLIYICCPLVFRNSFQALSGISYGFFVMLSMYLISEGIKRDGKLIYAILSGLAITCAAATRYEAWVIIATFTLVTLLFKQWRFTVIFWIFAMLFPATWMIGNQLEFGDFLYSVNQNDVWNIQLEGINDSVNSIEKIKRIVFFPLSLALNVSPITLVLTVIVMVSAAYKRCFTKNQLIWLAPFLILFFLFLQKGWAGTLMLQHRFTITWIVLFLPFIALIFQNEKLIKLKTGLLITAVITTIPLSFFWEKVPYTLILGENSFGWAVDNIALNTFREIEAVPLLKDHSTEKMVDTINYYSKTGDGLILDFFGWDRTYFTALRSKNRSFITPGAKHENIELQLLEKYLVTNESGLILLHRLGKLTTESKLYQDTLLIINNSSYMLDVNEITSNNEYKLFYYTIVYPSQSKSFLDQSFEGVSVFPSTRDVAYFEVLIKNDPQWFNSIKRTAFWSGEPVDVVLKRTALSMYKTESKGS